MNILMLVIKNTASLDFALPLLWKIKKQAPAANVSLLFCTLSRSKILRQSKFYDTVLSEAGITQYDFADFLPASYAAFRGLWRQLGAKSNWDSSPWEYRLSKLPGASLPLKALQYSRTMAENLLARQVNYRQILPSLNPDIVLFDNTAATRFYGRDDFYEYFSRVRKKLILLPHAPHHGYAAAFTPFDEHGEALPSYCEFWIPFKFAQPWVKIPEKRSQFVYVGYPGMDSEWLKQCLPRKLPRPDEPLRCLFIIRRFLPEGQPRKPGDNAFIYNYEEFTDCLSLVKTALEQSEREIELIVKPHPSNDFQLLRHVFAMSGIPRWRISNESVYANLAECDMAISLYSTVPLITAMAGIPTVLLGGQLQSMIQEDTTKQLYSGIHFYLDDPQSLPSRMKDIVEIAFKRRISDTAWQQDVGHLRNFYPDGALQRCLDRLGM